MEVLRAVERTKLADTDTALLDAALGIAGQVRRLPDAPASEPADVAAEPGAGAGAQVRGTGGRNLERG